MGLGVDATAAAEKSRWMGPARYDVWIIIKILLIGWRKPLPCTLEIDGEAKALDLFVLTIMNNKFTGTHHRVSPYAQMDDGKIDIMYTPNPIRSVSKALKLDDQIKKGGTHVLDPLVAYATATSSIKLTSDQQIRVLNDGDIIGFSPVQMSVMPQAVSVLTPEESKPC